MPTIQDKLAKLRFGKVPVDERAAIIDEVLALLNATPEPQPMKLTEITGKRVQILTPIYRGMNGRTFFTLWRCFGQYGVDKIGLIPEFQTVIHEARNMLAQKFLATDSEWAIMVDDDLVIPSGSAGITNGYFRAGLPEPSASFNAISRIMSHPVDKLVIGAVYCIKGTPALMGHPLAGKVVTASAFKDEASDRELRKITGQKGLMEDEWVGLGFSRIHRSVFQTIIDAAPGRWPELTPSREGRHWGIFNPLGPDINEDISFCKRCRALGIKLWLDRDLVCGHSEGSVTWWPSSPR